MVLICSIACYSVICSVYLLFHVCLCFCIQSECILVDFHLIEVYRLLLILLLLCLVGQYHSVDLCLDGFPADVIERQLLLWLPVYLHRTGAMLLIDCRKDDVAYTGAYGAITDIIRRIGCTEYSHLVRLVMLHSCRTSIE